MLLINGCPVIFLMYFIVKIISDVIINLLFIFVMLLINGCPVIFLMYFIVKIVSGVIFFNYVLMFLNNLLKN